MNLFHALRHGLLSTGSFVSNAIQVFAGANEDFTIADGRAGAEVFRVVGDAIRGQQFELIS